MKKLMIMLGAVVMAAAVQAATCNWSATMAYTYDGKTTTKANATTAAVYGILFVDATASTISTALAKGDFSVLSQGVVGITSNATAMMNPGTTVSADTFSEGNHTAFAVIFSGADPTSSKYFYVTDSQTMELSNAGNTKFAFGNLSTAANPITATSNWTTVATPEPTSGLLLLLGMAGLALKRKRA